ncbi:hypothetical protein CDV36_012074 [Fusarium kuroshium]|uniref:Cyanovirin-N domain-containing protein n=1 Tax=Fusarium kuroshium TaxID=2010991 RepID=A0A3M2RSU9_9HYPO|nr:hypothetical protein CDV36_012074 [Fusarium kuroshium]
MSFNKLAHLALLAPAAMGLVVPKGITPEQLDKMMPRGVDQPGNPRLDFGKDSCFSTGAISENEEWTGCEPTNKLDDEGHCSISPHSDDACESFCEKSLKWSYGKEVKFANAECRRGKCTLEDRMAVTFGETISWGLQIGHGAFTAGVSFTYSQEKQTFSGVVRDKPDDLIDECGYWTFVPYMVTSCGITAKGEHTQNAFTGEKCKNRVEKEECLTDYLRHSDGMPAGVPVFVTYDCATRERLAFCKQDELYLKLGVSEDEKVHQDYALSWWDGDASRGPTGTAQVMCEKGIWPPS